MNHNETNSLQKYYKYKTPWKFKSKLRIRQTRNRRLPRQSRINRSVIQSFEDQNIWVQDDTEAFIRGYELNRELYITPVAQFKLNSWNYQKLLKALYWLPEFGDSLFQTYKNSLKNIKISGMDSDPPFHYPTGNNNTNLQGKYALYVDGTLASGDNQCI